MNSSRKKYVGRNGTLIIGKDGITIERSARLAMNYGGARKTTVRFEDLGEIRHQQSAFRPGYLQFTTKQGVDGVTPMNRVTKIHFNRDEAHQFRRARDVINERLKNMPSQGSSGVPNLTNEDGPHRPPAGSLGFRRRF